MFENLKKVHAWVETDEAGSSGPDLKSANRNKK